MLGQNTNRTSNVCRNKVNIPYLFYFILLLQISIHIFREFLAGVPPPLVKAICTFNEENRLNVEIGDMIALIDERPDLKFIKGQNQRSFEIGTFPRYYFKSKNFISE